jgi:protein SDA1
MMAARSLISLFRIVNPELLPKKERGKNADLTSKPKGFGEVNVRSNIEGTELLEKYGDDADFMENMSYEEFDSDEFDEDDESGSIENSDDEVSGEVNDAEGDEKSDNDNEDDEEKEEDDEEDEEIDENDLEELGSGEELDLDEIEWSDEEDDDDDEDGDNENMNGDDDEIPKLEPITKDDVSRSSKNSRATARSDVSSRLEAREILSEEDWAKLRKLQQWKRSNDSDRPTRKRKHEEMEMDQGNDDVDIEAIEGSVKKKQKLTKEERADLLRENRDSKDRFKVKKAGEKGSKTNAMNAKGKPFQMIKHSKRVKRKLTTSMHEKKTKLASQIKKNRIFMELKKKKR